MRRLSMIAATLALAVVGVLAAAVPAFADTVIEVTPLNPDAHTEIQKKLNLAREGAGDDSIAVSAKNPLVVKVTPGSYRIGRSLRLYSNTTLVLEGVTLSANPLASNNMIRIGEASDVQSGYYYRNITVKGGILLHGNRPNTAIKMAHAKNVRLEGVTVQDAVNGHLVEVAGINGLTVEGCAFRNQTQRGASAAIPEAFQIDILNKKHMPGYLPEDLPMKNVTINNCLFENVPRGLGSHTSVLNSYVRNVTITNNTFRNLKSDAIRTMNYLHCRIEGNVIENAAKGISVYMGHSKGMYFATSLAKEGGVPTATLTKYKAPPKNQDIVVKNNRISIAGRDIYSSSQSDGIFLCGYSFSHALRKTLENDAIPRGNYYVSGVTVSNNRITSTGNGIRIDDARNVTVRDNVITAAGIYGITAQNGARIGKLSSNSLSNTGASGISVLSGSSVDALSSNKVRSSRESAVYVGGKSSVRKVSSNTLKSPRKNGVLVNGGASIAWLGKNRVTSPGKCGLLVEGASVQTITKNTVSSPKNIGVLIREKARVTKVTSNTVKNGKRNGIVVREIGRSVTISKNKIAKCKKIAIVVATKDEVYRVSLKKNKLTGRKSLAAVKVSSGKATVSGSRRL